MHAFVVSVSAPLLLDNTGTNVDDAAVVVNHITRTFRLFRYAVFLTLNVKQGSCAYQFLSLCFDPTKSISESTALIADAAYTLSLLIDILNQNQKRNLQYSRGIAPMCVTRGEAHLLDLETGQHSSEETTQRWRAVGDTVPNMTGPAIKLRTSRTDSHVFNHYANGPVSICIILFI